MAQWRVGRDSIARGGRSGYERSFPRLGGRVLGLGLVAVVAFAELGMGQQPDKNVRPMARRSAPAPGRGAARVAQRPVPGASAGVTAFVHVGVIPMDTERVLLDQTVLVEGGHITALGAASQVAVPAGAVQIDGWGRYLIPGLADMHTHVNNGEPPKGVAADTAFMQRLFGLLTQGVTTLRSMSYTRKGSPVFPMLLDGPELLRMRDRAAAGELWSPRIYVAGQWGPDEYVTSGCRYGCGGAPSSGWVPRLDSVAAYLAAYKAAGYDFVKVHDESPAVFNAVLAAARRVGIPVAGHVTSTLEEALAGGMRSIEHMTGYPADSMASDSAIQATAAATLRAGTWNSPTLSFEVGFVESAARHHLRAVRALHAAGAGLLLGSDLGSVHRELEYLVQVVGLTPYEALVTGTRNVAAYFNTLDESGTVAVGKRADLVLLDGNPLTDIGQTNERAGVMIGGRWLSRAQLDQSLEAIIDAPTP